MFVYDEMLFLCCLWDNHREQQIYWLQARARRAFQLSDDFIIFT